MFQEQSFTRARYGYRLATKLLRPSAISNLKLTLSSQVTDRRSICDYLEHNALSLGDKSAIRFEDQDISWAELNERVNRFAHYFKSRDLVKGDAVAVNIENRPEVIITVLACLKLGLIAGMVNTRQTDDVLAHSLKLINPKLLVVGAEQVENMSSLDAGLTKNFSDKLLFVADGALNKVTAGYTDLGSAIADQPASNPAETRELVLGDPCYYIFTSGTTGLPKASITTHLKVFRSGSHMGLTVMNLTSDDVFYCALPFYHSNALTLALSGALMSGATLAIGRKFSASGFWDEIRRYGATTFCYIGELLRYLLTQPEQANDRDHQVVKILGNGLRPDIWMAFKNRFGIDRIHEFYGASEGNSAFVNIFNFDKTCGWSPGNNKTWAVVEYDIADDEVVRAPDGTMKKMAVGETGLLIMKVNEQYPFDGYTDQQASEKKLFRDVFEPGDCWFNSGDLVMRQPFGHIQFADRIGDTFRWQGENVATTEVEGAVADWTEAEDAVVYGVSVPGRDGRCGMLYVTPREGSAMELAGLPELLRNRLPGYAVPRFLRVGRATSLTGTFKYQKSQLKKEAYDCGSLEDDIFFLAPASDAFVKLTSDLQKQIDDGDVRL
ncbi:MAG: long-chain-acyl-CoA synthetase [Parvibaculales bacterium]